MGAGPAGLAAAAMLRRAGVDVVVVDKAERVGASWRGHYDRLHLHTVRWLSHLPGYRFSARHGALGLARRRRALPGGRTPRHHRLDLELGTAVERIDRDGDGWVLRTSRGDLRAEHVVVATGYNHTPYLEDWPGRDSFQGELVHASGYRNPEPFRGRDVLVVGPGNTGAEIAVDLVEGGAGRCASRSARRPTSCCVWPTACRARCPACSCAISPRRWWTGSSGRSSGR